MGSPAAPARPRRHHWVFSVVFYGFSALFHIVPHCSTLFHRYCETVRRALNHCKSLFCFVDHLILVRYHCSRFPKDDDSIFPAWAMFFVTWQTSAPMRGSPNLNVLSLFYIGQRFVCVARCMPSGLAYMWCSLLSHWRYF